MKVEVAVNEQNGQRSFEVAMIVEDVSNAIEYIKLENRKVVIYTKLNILRLLYLKCYCYRTVNVWDDALYGDADYQTWTEFTMISPKDQIQKVDGNTSVNKDLSIWSKFDLIYSVSDLVL